MSAYLTYEERLEIEAGLKEHKTFGEIARQIGKDRTTVALKQANTDSSKMAEVIGVSDAQLRFVTNSQSDMGLLKCGNVVIPFDNQIGKDTEPL